MTSRFKRDEIRGMSPYQLREDRGCGLQEASRLLKVTRLLDDLEQANTLSEVKSIIAQFITMQTGVE